MPIFDWVCVECSNMQEVITMRASELPEVICNTCGSKNMMRCVPNKFGFKLLGEGWAEDGYSYEYTKPRIGEEHVKPVYSRKKVAETIEGIRTSMKGDKDETGS